MIAENNENFILLPLYWKVAVCPEGCRHFGRFHSGKVLSLSIYCLVYIAFFSSEKRGTDKIGRGRIGTYSTARKTHDVEIRPVLHYANLAPRHLIRLPG